MIKTTQKFLGILMLDTRFPRPLGDVGNLETYRRAGIPVRFVIVKGASPKRIVQDADPTLLQPFVEAAMALVEQGAEMISTSCGFLASYQNYLSKILPVPVITSSLLQCKHYTRPAIVTIDSSSLIDDILSAADVPIGTPVQGVEPGCEFHQRILNNDTELDVSEAERNIVAAALKLLTREPNVENIILECTNMPPYREAVAKATGRRVHDIETLLTTAWRQRSEKS